MQTAPDQSAPSVVFIISQPRAGSTLLQTMLSRHPRVTAPGETWLMLPLVHAIGGASRGIDTPYDSCLADDAINEFTQSNLAGGLSDLERELGAAARRIYTAACRRAGADILIDKTPRYYWIIEELLQLIPDSRIILLLRNPLAVMSSIIHTWTRPSSVGFLSGYRADLLEAPARLANAASLDDERISVVGYEQLVITPEDSLDAIQRFIGLEPVEGLSEYGEAPQQIYGDPQGIYRDTAANQKSVDKWITAAAESAAIWRLLDDYRRALGESLLGRLGYSYQQLGDRLADVRPQGTTIAPPLRLQIAGRPREPVQSLVRARRLLADTASKFGRAA